jgi:hypothetical protein
MKFHHFNRRSHLYLGLFLMPWFFLYGLSSIPFSHPAWGRAVYGEAPQWTVLFERPYELPLAPDGDLREIGAVLSKEAGIQGTYGAYRPNPNRINVYVHTFWDANQISYDIPGKKLRAETRHFRWDHWLTGFHARGGFQHENFMNDAWAVIVDIVCVGFLVWVGSGLYMWWHLKKQRNWGWLALGSGVASFIIFLLTL